MIQLMDQFENLARIYFEYYVYIHCPEVVFPTFVSIGHLYHGSIRLRHQLFQAII